MLGAEVCHRVPPALPTPRLPAPLFPSRSRSGLCASSTGTVLAVEAERGSGTLPAGTGDGLAHTRHIPLCFPCFALDAGEAVGQESQLYGEALTSEPSSPEPWGASHRERELCSLCLFSHAHHDPCHENPAVSPYPSVASQGKQDGLQGGPQHTDGGARQAPRLCSPPKGL